MLIRPECANDIPAIRSVNQSAFESNIEADLVERLRADSGTLISLVAEDNRQIVGHILFSPASMDDRSDLKIMGLGPMAVVPTRQRQGIGSMLVTAGLNACRAAGVGAVIVLGHPHYYPRFGFESAALYDIQCKYDAPDGAFMVLELKPDYLRDASGMIRYHSAFDGL